MVEKVKKVELAKLCACEGCGCRGREGKDEDGCSCGFAAVRAEGYAFSALALIL